MDAFCCRDKMASVDRKDGACEDRNADISDSEEGELKNARRGY
jgi:hypothetical protein